MSTRELLTDGYGFLFVLYCRYVSSQQAEIPTENEGVRLPITNFSVPDSLAPFFDSNRNRDVAILR